MWERNETLHRRITSEALTLASDKGAIHIRPRGEMKSVSYETSGSNGKTRHANLAFCMPSRNEAAGVVTALGKDREAIREDDRHGMLFDLGIGAGLVSLCVRTNDPDLVAVLQDAEGRSLLSGQAPLVMPMIMEKQPHRVMLSPLGRIEVYQGIPPADGKSPEGPHTHVFPAAIAEGLLHAGNIPIPEGFQSVLYMHPRPAS